MTVKWYKAREKISLFNKKKNDSNTRDNTD